MAEKSKRDKYRDLHDLLISWGMDELFEHLKEEDINVCELEMMKMHHMEELLRNFKLGVRIRFEYHFEKWRYSIFKPLKKNVHRICSTDSKTSVQKSLKINSISKEANQVQTSPKQSTEKHELIIPLLNLPVGRDKDDGDATIRRNALKRNGTDLDDNSDSQITVLKIIHTFGRQGLSLIEFYEQNQCFTNPQRQMLVQLIVNFFEINDFHLSLKTSYILERQIVKYFPNEKLEYYRTDKRGKIYSKYSNMKRKRAETIGNAIKSLTAQDTSTLAEQEISLDSTNNIKNDENEHDNDIDLCDDSNDQDYSSLPVKIEYVRD